MRNRPPPRALFHPREDTAAVSASRLNNRNTGSIPNEIYQTTTTTGNTQINVANGIQHFTGSLMGSWQQCNDSWVDAILLQYLMNQLY